MTDTDRELEAQFLNEGLILPLLAHLVLFALLLVLTWGAVPQPLLAAWGGAVGGCSMIRVILRNLARRKTLTTETAVRLTRVTMLVLGIAWGGSAAFAFPYLPLADVALILLSLTGLLAGGLATLVADRWTFPVYAVAMFTPPTIAVGVTGRPDLFDELGVVLIITYLAFAVRLHFRSHQALRNRFRIEEALREGERKLSEAQRIAHVGSWEWDIRTNAVAWSDELRRMYGVSAGAPAGYREFLALAHPDDRARIEALVAEGLQARRTVDYEWRVVRPDGAVRYMQARNVVITDGHGEAIRMAGTSLDITDRRNAEENQRALLHELQASVAEVKVLRGILPICANCKRIRDNDGQWEAVESYVREHTNAEFTHGLCPDCAQKTWV